MLLQKVIQKSLSKRHVLEEVNNASFNTDALPKTLHFILPLIITFAKVCTEFATGKHSKMYLAQEASKSFGGCATRGIESKIP
jgi:hypothetical protein